MTSFSLTTSSWKDIFMSLASDPHYSGCSLSSIKAAPLTFSTQETLRFLESDSNLVLLTDDDGNSLLVLHHFHTISQAHNQNDQKLVAIAGFIHLATPVIINTSSVKNYSQIVPKWELFQNTKTISEFQNYNSELEPITLRNAIIIPLPLLRIILTSPDQSPAALATKILHEMHQLDHLINAKTIKDSSHIELAHAAENKTNNTFTQDSFIENCGYIIQWLFLAQANRIKPVHSSLA
jgi:hypothetical protein